MTAAMAANARDRLDKKEPPLSDDAIFDDATPTRSRGLIGRLTGWGVKPAPMDRAPLVQADRFEQASVAPQYEIDDRRVQDSAAAGALAVYNLGKSYGGRAVVKDVSVSLRRGEAVGLLGPNGAGKTTVFYMI